MKAKLFQYSIVYSPEKGKAKVVKEVTSILAKDAEQARTLVSREIPAEFLDNLEEVEIMIRPFQ